MNIKNKTLLMIVGVLLLGIIAASGTYAYLIGTVNVKNESHTANTMCFLIDYNINNVDGSKDITGTLFPSSGPSGGLSGRVGLKVNETCDTSGTGILKLHINSETSSKFATVGAAHCENPTTLETLKDYKTSSTCSGHGTWTTSSTVFKYAIYDDPASTTPVKVGYLKNSDIGNDITLLNNIAITSTQQYYYIYIWLDGYLTDNTYVELPFSGYIKAEATQNDKS